MEAPEEEEDEERMCRYCFCGPEDGGELIAPCDCAGGQKWVHLSCLRRWQRMVLVSQPTHPSFYKDDQRHHVCNVCNGPLRCAPPARHELMESFTGPELAALLTVGCVIGAHRVFSDELKRQIEAAPGMAEQRGLQHWMQGVYLITNVRPDDGRVELPLMNQQQLHTLCLQMDRRPGPDGTIQLSIMNHAKRLVLVPAGSLEGVAPSDLNHALAGLQLPGVVHFQSESASTMGDDHIAAVNLTGLIREPPDQALVHRAVANATAHHPGAARVALSHYLGGPCGMESVACCVVPGAAGCGWAVVPRLEQAVRLAAKAGRQGELRRGSSLELTGLIKRPDLNGQLGIALQFNSANQRWKVRLASGSGLEVKPANLRLVGRLGKSSNADEDGHVMVFWGDAQWSRTQLLGEIARGHWGMGRASCQELIAGYEPVRPALIAVGQT